MISTVLAAIPEIVRSGETGLLVRPRDLLAVVGAPVRLRTDTELRLRMGRRAAEIAAAEHDAERYALHLLELVKGVTRGELTTRPPTG